MKKHEHPTNRLEKMSNFFGGGNFSKLNLYKQEIKNKMKRRRDVIQKKKF